jgi:hypothetical protein
MDRYPKIIDFLKTGITYPRAGYVKPPAEPLPDQDLLHDIFTGRKSVRLITLKDAPPISENVSDFRVQAITLILIAHTIGMVTYAYPNQWNMPVLMTGFAALVFLLNRRDAHPYAWWSVLPIALTGFLTFVLGSLSKFTMVFPLLVFGAWLLAQGAGTLIRFLQNHPRMNELEGGPA